MKRLRLLRIFLLLVPLLFAVGAEAATLPDQTAVLYSTNYQRGINWHSKGGLPRTGTGLPPTVNQFRATLVYGTVSYPTAKDDNNVVNGVKLNAGAAGSFAGNAERLGWPHGKDGNTVKMVLRLQAGAPYMTRFVSFYFGSVIPTPAVDIDGTEMSAPTIGTYWAAEPAGHPVTGHANAPYYWSPHANTLYATQPGRIDITWRVAAGTSVQPATGSFTNIGGLYYRLLATNYVVSGAAAKTPRKMYWTQGRYSDVGKPVLIPTARVGDVKVVYNNNTFPEFVAKEKAIYESSEPFITNLTDRTLWYDTTATKQILARNIEGRVFVELLGDIRSGTKRNQLGYEIVDVFRQANPADVATDLGDKLLPPPPGSDTHLVPEPLTTGAAQTFVYQHNVAGSDRMELYATRETANQNDYQVFWMEEGVAGLRWPVVMARYSIKWPTAPAKYSHYLRPLSNKETGKATAVPLPTDNIPMVEFQDPLDEPRAFLTEDFKFYTFLDAKFPAHRTLLRFTAGDNVAFERVFSWLDVNLRTPEGNAGFVGSPATSLTAWTTNSNHLKFRDEDALKAPRVISTNVWVGERLVAPSLELSTSTAGVYVPGYIRQSEGTGFSVTAYKDPFVVGFDEAAKGAIIPVNASNNTARLEVWWYRSNTPDLAKGFQTIYWPAVIGKYSVRWPTNAPESREIILASNDGSGPLTSLEASGTIYFQNDPAQPGYNPNEEHALMLGGQAYALRDDLNVTNTQRYSSHPYVLVEFTDRDGRPRTSVFQVLREKGDIKFNYAISAGTRLQPPMPLPFLEKPVGRPNIAGGTPATLNVELREWTTSASSATEANGISQVQVTTSARHFFAPYETLALQNVAPSGTMTTHWLYSTNVNPTDRTISGVVSENRPLSLSYLGPNGSSYRYALTSQGGVTFQNQTVMIVRQSLATNWLVTASTHEGYIEVFFEGTVPEAADKADLLVIPIGGATANQFQNRRLAYTEAPADAALRERFTTFTLADRKKDLWVYRGPHDRQDQSKMVMQFYYKILPGFFFPGESMQPAAGTITPYLRPLNADGTYAGNAVYGDGENNGVGNGIGDGNSLGIKYRPAWPDGVPVLHMAESLTLPKRGLPSVRNQRSLEIVYQQPQFAGGSTRRAAVLHDPTRAKIFELGSDSGSKTTLGKIPASVKTQEFRGKVYFPNLPPHLSERFYFDPNRGKHGALVLEGRFIDAAVGDDYLLLNIVGDRDGVDLKKLCLGNENGATPDPLKAAWDQAITSGLKTVMEKFVKNPAKPGTFIASAPEAIASSVLAEVKDDDVAVDSYALTAIGPGTGYVTLLAGNGENSEVTPIEEPVSVHVLRVVDTLYPGEIKIVQGSNPLSELVTLQQVVDLAGKVDDYEFEWKITSPVDGKPPAVYRVQAEETLLPDGSWNHVQFPLAADTPGGVNITAAPASRRSTKTVETIVAEIPFQSVSTNDAIFRKLHFVSSNTSGLAAGNQLVVQYADNNATRLNATVSQVLESEIVVTIDGGQIHPAGNPAILYLYERALVNRPQSILFREFTVTSGVIYSDCQLSLDLDDGLGAKVYIDGQLVVTANMDTGNSTQVAAPTAFDALPKSYALRPEFFAAGSTDNGVTTHRVVVELFSTALPNVAQRFKARIHAFPVVDEAVIAGSKWLPLDPEKYRDKVRAIMGGTADVRALSDNYLICRYRASSTTHASYRADDVNGAKRGWSRWTEPQLAEGWIKRVLAGINPFNQRVTDLFNNRVNTDVSILTQAGPRWEGDVALNLDTINDYGLIAIYETVLNRGKMLSIGGGINFGPANDALLLAAGYLNDLYMMLGNEAWADAANPTIGIGTKDRTYGDIATALFAFKGQTASLLEEELALLRGRDDFMTPGVESRPVYNRLFWNYTRGIDAGEVIYALNYNIQENNDTGVNGVIDADDARKMFPQGHGDAYGHYLTALKGYYALLMDTDFDWVPRIEAVNVLGKAVSVDYQDERKFAAAAAAVARAGRQVFDLTWRKDYVPGDDVGWKYFATNRVNHTRAPGVPRFWGLDHWASRTVEGAYINWAMGNSILPAVDPDSKHEGIQKVDRTTVPELKELAATAEDLQTALDNAEAHLNPLGLGNGSLAFDINPSRVTGGAAETHFEQVYGRAKVAFNNALAAFDDAKDVTRLMRSEQDSLAELQTAVSKQELAYKHTLVEIYGTPYPDDIGPGRTYKQGYDGPDLDHYMYVDTTDLNIPGFLEKGKSVSFKIDIQQHPSDWPSSDKIDFGFFARSDSIYAEGKDYVSYELPPHGFGKPSGWTGKRASPGVLQQKISHIVQAHDQIARTLKEHEALKYKIDRRVELFAAAVGTHEIVTDAEQALEAMNLSLESLAAAKEATIEHFKFSIWKAFKVFMKLRDAIPLSQILGAANGGDLTSAARAAATGTWDAVTDVFGLKALAQNLLVKGAFLTFEKREVIVQNEIIDPAQWEFELKQWVYELDIMLKDFQLSHFTILEQIQKTAEAQHEFEALVGRGDRIRAEREVFRQRAAAVVQGFRTRDAAFRIFRNEKLERYKTLFDLAARYAYLASTAFDYETGLLHTKRGKEFISRIVNTRALGVVRNGEPQYAGSNTGDPGLSSVLAEMKADFDVLKSRLGFNNPNSYGTTVSLRMEKERIIGAEDAHPTWQDVLQRARRDNLLADEDVRRYCMQIDRGNGLAVPGIVLEFSTTIQDGANLFGRNLAGGDHYFGTSLFATKIFGIGVAFEGYVGMDNPVANSTAVGAAQAYSPPDPNVTFLGSQSLAATPGIYLIPVGVDSMRSPPLGDASKIRSWNVNDVTIPLPFNIGGSDFSTKQLWQSSESLSEPLFGIRKHAEFRPVSTTAAFSSSIYAGGGNLQLSQFTNNRLIGRSVWNSKWKLVIPGHKLLHDPNEGLDRFINTVKDIKLHFVTYSYAGN